MRGFIILSSIMFFLSGALSAQEEQFVSANKAYNDSDYKTSIEIYDKILSEGYESSDLYLNLGNAYLKNGALGSAILNYERGLKIESDHVSLQQNLKYANKQIEVSLTEIPDFFLSRYWQALVSSFGSTGWALLQIILFSLLAVALGFWLLSKKLKTKKLAFYSMIALCFGLLLSLLTGTSKYKSERNASHAIVLAEKCQLRMSASSQSESLLDLSEGVKVKLLDRIDDYYKVQLIDKEIGWISITDIESI